jgi:hypothetical protein
MSKSKLQFEKELAAAERLSGVLAQTIEHMLASFGCKPSDFEVAVLKTDPVNGPVIVSWWEEYKKQLPTRSQSLN